MSPRPALLPVEDNPVTAVDLSAPGEYQKQLNLAAMIATFLLAMPLEEMARRADDECDISLLSFNSDSSKELRRTRELLSLLASAQRQLVKIRARYGDE
jgi:hypothetical protein